MTKRSGFFLGLMLVVRLGSAGAEAIKLHPSNPPYNLFNGQPTILITSAEHYGGGEGGSRRTQACSSRLEHQED